VLVVVRCPSCGGEASVPDSLHGQAVQCPRCQMRFTAPDSPPQMPNNRPLLPPPPLPLPPNGDQKPCVECLTPIRRAAVVCPNCGVPQPGGTTVHYQQPGEAPLLAARPVAPPPSNRIIAGIMGILFGCLGVHKFILGYNTEGLIMLAVTIFGGMCTAGIGSVAMWGIGIAEGIIYLTKSDAEFHENYVIRRRGWF
jgi:TM2 domain-containing membrane protein YozV